MKPTGQPRDDIAPGEPLHAMTLQQIGEQLHITREGVRKIEIRAMRKVALALQERGITSDALLGPDSIAPGWPRRSIRRSD